MPIENERKFVLCKISEEYVRQNSDKMLNIRQGYLLREKGITVRVRQVFGKKTKHYMTVKQRINGHIVEIEKKIDKEDYDALATVATGWLTKTRYNLDGWEIDFFKDGDKVYFIMAEIELPADVEEPDFLPPIVLNNLLHKVPKEDTRFSSKKLSDVDYAVSLLEEVKKQHSFSDVYF